MPDYVATIAFRVKISAANLRKAQKLARDHIPEPDQTLGIGGGLNPGDNYVIKSLDGLVLTSPSRIDDKHPLPAPISDYDRGRLAGLKEARKIAEAYAEYAAERADRPRGWVSICGIEDEMNRYDHEFTAANRITSQIDVLIR